MRDSRAGAGEKSSERPPGRDRRRALADDRDRSSPASARPFSVRMDTFTGAAIVVYSTNAAGWRLDLFLDPAAGPPWVEDASHFETPPDVPLPEAWAIELLRRARDVLHRNRWARWASSLG